MATVLSVTKDLMLLCVHSLAMYALGWQLSKLQLLHGCPAAGMHRVSMQ